MSARDGRLSNSDRSVPVIQAWAPSARISSNKAALRRTSRCAAISSSSSSGARPSRARVSSQASASTMEISSAFCSPVEHSRASARFSVWRTARSLQMRPEGRAAGFGVADAGAREAARASCASRFAEFREQHVGLALQRQLGAGKRARFAAFGQHRVQPRHGRGARARRSRTPASAISASSPSSHSGIARTEFQQPRPFAHRGFVARGAPRMGRHRSRAPAGRGTAAARWRLR